MHAVVPFPTTPRAVKAVRPKLNKRMNAGQAFARIVRACLAQVEANREGVARFHDVESLHQMRVGLRRLRAALAMFGDLVQLPAAMQDELDWLSGRLGAARDWDVLLASTLPKVAQRLPDGDALPRLHDAAARAAGLMHEQAAGAVSSPRYDRLMLVLQRWLERRAWRDALTRQGKSGLKMRAADFAGAIFEQDWQRLRKRGRKLRHGTSEQRHRMRIAAKRSRYATEFFASLFPARQVRPYVAALATLQDELGWMNDAAVADRLLGELAAQHQEVREDAGVVRGVLACGAAADVARVRKRWKKLRPLAAPH